MDKRIQFITRTAAILAVTVIFQLLRVFIPALNPALLTTTLIIGSLVNLGLLLGVSIVGISGGLIIAVITPFIALLTGHIGNVYQLILVWAGNISIILAYGFLSKKVVLFKNILISCIIWVVVAAAIKFGIMWAGATYVAPLFLTGKFLATVFKLGQTFQLFTALIGGGLMLLILPVIKKAIKFN